MIKWIGAVLIIAGFSYCGYERANKLLERLKRLRCIHASITVFETQIDYALMSIPDCFEKIGQDSNKIYLQNFYEDLAVQLRSRGDETFGTIWKMGVEKYLKSDVLTSDDCEMINLIGDMPLYLNKEIQITILQSVKMQIHNVIVCLEQECSSKCKIYKISGLSMGILFVLLLI